MILKAFFLVPQVSIGNAKSALQQESVIHLIKHCTNSSEILTAFYSE